MKKILKFFIILILSISFGQNSFAAAPPVVSTNSSSSITATTATISGVLMDNGTESNTQRGFEYGTTNSYGSTTSESGSFDSAITFSMKFGTSGSGNGQFNLPYALAVDSLGNIFVVDANNHRVQKFNSSGVYQSQFGSSGSGDGQFSAPQFITIDSSDNIYISDFNNCRIQKFNSSFVFQMKFGSCGTGNGQFNKPLGTAIDSSGNIYVVDSNNNRIQKFNSSGVYQSQFGNSDLAGPVDVAIDTSDNIYVSNYSSENISKFDSSGSLVSTIIGLDTPQNLHVDSSGNVYVISHQGFKIQKFDSSGNSLYYYGQYGTSADGTFNYPRGLFVDSDHNIYIADTSNNRIQKFSDTGISSAFSANLTGLTCNTLYSYRAYSTNSNSTGYGSEASFTTLPCNPTVSTNSASSITTTSAILHGKLTNSGGANSSQRGFEYGLTNIYGNTTLETGNYNDTASFLLKFGSNGSGNGQFSSPRGLAVDLSGNIFVVDRGNNRIQKFDSTGNYLTEFSVQSPFDIVIDSNGNLYVSKYTAGEIEKFDSLGTSLGSFGGLDQPQHIAIDSSNNIYVSDYSSSIVYKFDSFGNVLWQIDSSNNIDGPLGIDVDSNGDIFFVDKNNSLVKKFDTNGNYVTEFSIPSGSSGLSIDSMDNIYITDIDLSGFYKYSPNGTYISTFGSYGTDDGQFYDPVYFFIDHNDYMYLSESGNNRIQKFVSDSEFLYSLSSLTCGSTYHYRAYSTNTAGTGTGSDATFTTSPCPTTATQPSSSSGSSASSRASNLLNMGKTKEAQEIINQFPNATKNIQTSEISKPRLIKSLKKGTKNNIENVKFIQKVLSLTQDGKFGPKTEKAVKDFQKLHNLKPDGIVGPKTWAELGMVI